MAEGATAHAEPAGSPVPRICALSASRHPGAAPAVKWEHEKSKDHRITHHDASVFIYIQLYHEPSGNRDALALLTQSDQT